MESRYYLPPVVVVDYAKPFKDRLAADYQFQVFPDGKITVWDSQAWEWVESPVLTSLKASQIRAKGFHALAQSVADKLNDDWRSGEDGPQFLARFRESSNQFLMIQIRGFSTIHLPIKEAVELAYYTIHDLVPANRTSQDQVWFVAHALDIRGQRYAEQFA